MTSTEKLKKKMEELVKERGVGMCGEGEGGREDGSSVTSLLIRTPICRESPALTSFSKPHSLLKTPSSNTITLGVKASQSEWGVCKIQSIANGSMYSIMKNKAKLHIIELPCVC